MKEGGTVHEFSARGFEFSGQKWLNLDLNGCIKGQLISEWLFDVLNIPKKNNAKSWWISALESKKWLNQKDKGTLLC